MKTWICLTCAMLAARLAAGVPAPVAPVFFEPAGHGYLAHTAAGDLLLEAGGALTAGDLRLRFHGANPVPPDAASPLAAKVNRFPGDDPRAWRTGIPTFGRIFYRNLYPGIDLIYYGRAGRLECDFIVAPHADPNAIAIDLSGAAPALTARRDLVAGDLRLLRPRVFQEGRQIAGGFVLEGRRVRFRLAGYDRTRALTIDPVILYSTYLGGSATSQVTSAATDSSGNLYLTGQVSGSGLQAVNPLQSSGGMWVAKLDPTGANLLYATYLGGSGTADLANAIAVDAQGDAYIAGSTNSPDFPLVKPLQRRFNLGAFADLSSDAFIVKLDPTGSQMLFSTYLGGGSDDSAAAIALDAQGSAYVTGRTESIDFPTAGHPFSHNLNGAMAAFVSKLQADGSALVYSTYLGGNAYDAGNAIAVDSSGNALVLVYAASADFPGLRAAGGSLSPLSVVTKLSPTGSALLYTTSAGPASVAHALAVDASGNAWLAGSTTSAKLPATSAAPQKAPGGEVYFRSTDGGVTFTPNRGSMTTGAVNGLANAPGAASTIYAATADGVFQSLDDGANWSALTGGLPAAAINAVAVDPRTPATIYAAPAQGTSLYKSTDSGATWLPSSDILDSDLGFSCLAIDPNSSTIYAGGQGVMQSADGGETWSPAAAIPSAVVSLAIDPSNGAIVYAGAADDPNSGAGGGLFVSKDSGHTFAATTITNDTIAAILPDPNTPGTVYAAGAAALYKSTNSGATWSALPAGGAAGFASLAFDFAHPSVLYACQANGGVLRSADLGVTLTSLDTGFQAGGVTSCLFSANSVMHLGAVRGPDAFLMRLNPSGAIGYATYLGGRAADAASAIAVDASGNIWLAGATSSQDFPVASPVQPDLAGSANAFLAEFSPAGALLFSTFCGGSASDGATAVAIAPNGTAYVVGSASSADFPLVNALDPAPNGAPQPFVVAITP